MPGPFSLKNRYMLKTSENTHHTTHVIGRMDVVPVLSDKTTGTTECVALSRYEKMCVLHVRKKLSHLQLGSQSDEYG